MLNFVIEFDVEFAYSCIYDFVTIFSYPSGKTNANLFVQFLFKKLRNRKNILNRPYSFKE